MYSTILICEQMGKSIAIPMKPDDGMFCTIGNLAKSCKIIHKSHNEPTNDH